MSCIFSEPVNQFDSAPAEGEIWNFKTLNCDTPATLELIVNDSGSQFYIYKVMSYGDLIIISFISIFLVFMIIKTLWNFVWAETKRKL